MAGESMPFVMSDGPHNFQTTAWNPVPAVYVILDAYRRVIYIGETEDLARRMSEHRSNTWHPMYRYGPSLVYVEVTRGGNDARVLRQNALIREYAPPANVQGMPFRR
jgi:predicted GIY-YIG superfamily endonuclease